MVERKYRFFTISEYGAINGKPVYRIVSNGHDRDTLGNIYWYPAWKCWVFETEPGSIWSEDCLANIIAFLGEVNKETGK